MSRRALSGLTALLLLTACQTTQTAQNAVPEAPPEPERIVMDERDQIELKAALIRASTKPVDEVVGWANMANGKRGAVKILRDGFDEQNRMCREFHSFIVQKKLQLHATGFLCRQPDGVWEVVHVREYPLQKELEVGV